MMQRCPTLADLTAFLGGLLSQEGRDRMIWHLNRCLLCFERYTEVAELLDDFEAGEGLG